MCPTPTATTVPQPITEPLSTNPQETDPEKWTTHTRHHLATRQLQLRYNELLRFCADQHEELQNLRARLEDLEDEINP